MTAIKDLTDGRELVMVSNRLPVDRVTEPDGTKSWKTSPGGLVTAVEPIVEELGCVWVGWAGSADEQIDAFDEDAMRLVPVELSEEEIAEYYEGFSNATLWPLYHDVVARPEFHREWWERYKAVNARFAARVADEAPEGAVVWVHDYQLQLVPKMLRELRPDVTIAFFLHIPFPPTQLFAQMPWRRRLIEGLLGADVIGFQQVGDAVNFRHAAERYARVNSLGNTIMVPADDGAPTRSVVAQEFPISIDADAFSKLAERDDVKARAEEIRNEIGAGRRMMLGVDRLDYTKGIPHRLKAYGELLADGDVDSDEVVLVQVASPSRERVEAYQQLRDEVEGTVGRINGAYGSIKNAPVVYLHQSFDRREMAALYVAADALVVTPLRDGMNLVAKEYVACRNDEQGVLVLSEFAGAADELSDALLVNPHDIDGLKAGLLRALHMPLDEQQRRMRALRERVFDSDVSRWVQGFLGAVSAAADQRTQDERADAEAPELSPHTFLSSQMQDRLRRLATAPTLIVATDFDGTLSPLVENPSKARILPRAQRALDVLAASPGVHVAVLSGRSLASLAETGLRSDGWAVSGSHGAEITGLGADHGGGALTDDEQGRLDALARRIERVLGGEQGMRIERKPFGIAVHAREVADTRAADELLAAAEELGLAAGFEPRKGKMVREFSARKVNKGQALEHIRQQLPASPVIFLGDDVTDEDAFAVLGSQDLAIKVGEGQSRANERVADPEAATAVLAWLAQMRTGVVVGSS
ncbi:bifunctional alpha,alpha-trehalose-phosphate synthase (UDP-forming)/trehalose-phosphatase [Agrococcus casei]|uniref:bifunctional alpha,alpha-trehalose-phosphate synthase (UDP-forming)/trehalose-phosphatase n=1 Tax=Agrococcus casei TaxID=343512 RepID=UPI003F8FD5F8